MKNHPQSIFFFHLPRLTLSFLLILLSAFLLPSSASSQDEDFAQLNQLLTGGNPVEYLNVREKLLSYPYPELDKISKDTAGIKSLSQLNNLANRLLLETKDLFILREDIFVNNTPTLLDLPFYPQSKGDFKLSDTKPYAEIAYFYNLKLSYRKNDLKELDKSLWNNPVLIRQAAKTSLPARSLAYEPNKLPNNAVRLWSCRLKDDYVNNYFVKLRQWIKRYEEDLVFPVAYRGVAITRNEYRFFFRDLKNAEELSSFPAKNINGQEYYHTFRHPHQNSYGCEFLLSKDRLFSELNGRLCAISLKDILRPELIWETDLGEYTVCAKPVAVNDVLIVGLVNSRGEVWICGFRINDGSLQWSAYIGLSSFLSPVSIISEVEGNRLLVGTNHGVLVCLEPASGNIAWVRKYQPKKYSLFDYWHKDGYKDYFLNKGGSIAYDTQFIKIVDNGRLYYKPRESDYLYILDALSGSLQGKLLIDPDRFRLLGVLADSGIFLSKEEGRSWLKAIDLTSGRELYARQMPSGSLKGVLYPSSSGILFKLDETLYLLTCDGNRFDLSSVNTRTKGWLVSQGEKEKYVFVADDKMFSCLELFKSGQNDGYPEEETLSQRKQVRNDLLVLLGDGNPPAEKQKILLARIADLKIPLGEIYPIILDNLKNLRLPSWNKFIGGLNDIYGDEIVVYQDVEIKFSNFLRGSGLIEDNLPAKKITGFADGRPGRPFLKLLNGETQVLPIKVVKGEGRLGFYLLLGHGQLLCVSEEEKILWNRKIFFGPVWESGSELDQDRHIYACDLEVYLYNSTLIINDRINVIAVDASSGDYLWSITNKDGLFEEEGLFPPRSMEWDYRSRKLFVKYTMFYTLFLDDRLVVLHGNRAYSLDPETGYCRNFRVLDTEGVMGLAGQGKEAYLLEYSLKRIKVLDKKLNELRNLQVDFLNESKENWPEMSLVNGCLILHLKPKVFAVNMESGALAGSLDLSGLKRYYVRACQDKLFIIEPLRKLSSYAVNSRGLVLAWEFNADSPDLYSVWSPLARKAGHYIYADGRVFFPVRTKGEYSVIVIDYATGSQLYKKQLTGLKGPFFNLSEAARPSEGRIDFVISVVYTGDMPYEKDILRAAVEAYAEETVEIDSMLVSLNTRDGRIIKAEVLPSGSFCGKGISICQTKYGFIYDIYGSYLKLKRKR